MKGNENYEKNETDWCGCRWCCNCYWSVVDLLWRKNKNTLYIFK